MEGLTIRAMAAGDVGSVMAITQESREAAQWTAGDFERLASVKNGPVQAWVAEHATEVRGYVVLRHAAGEAEILNLAVAAACRRRGCAQQLVRHALAAARAAAAVRVFLEVRESNRAAIALYSRCGFQQAGRRVRYYVNPIEDALVLAREA